MEVPWATAPGLTVRVTPALPVSSVVAVVVVIVVVFPENDPAEVVNVTVAPLLGVPSVFSTVAVIFDDPPETALMLGELAATVTGPTKVTEIVLLTLTVETVTVIGPGPVAVKVVEAVPSVDVAMEEGSTFPPAVAEKETKTPLPTIVPSLFFTVAVIFALPPTTGDVLSEVSSMEAGALGSIAGNQSTPPQPASITTRAKSTNLLPINPPNSLKFFCGV